MTINDYAQNIANLIKSRPDKMDYHRLMYRIYVLSEIAEGERAFEKGQWRTQEDMERMWRTKHRVLQVSSLHVSVIQSAVTSDR